MSAKLKGASDEDAAAGRADFSKNTLAPTIGAFAKILGGKDFFGGDKLNLADICAYWVFVTLFAPRMGGEKFMGMLGPIGALCKRVGEFPAIKAWVEANPDPTPAPAPAPTPAPVE